MPRRSRAILITGTSTGIGRATAIRLAQRGLNVYATARREEAIADLTEYGCKTLALDVTDETAIQQAVDTITEREGAVGALINNAGYSQSGAIESVPMDVVRRQFETNLFGGIQLIQAVLPGMRAQGWGKIVNISSMGGKLTFPGAGVYHATKYAMEAVSDALRFEVNGFGIDVIVVEPGIIRTQYASAVARSVEEISSDPESPYAGFNRTIAELTRNTYESGMLNRLGGDPEDVAETVERALLSRKPHARYPVTLSARLLMAQRALLPDSLWDRFMATQFPQPGND